MCPEETYFCLFNLLQSVVLTLYLASALAWIFKKNTEAKTTAWLPAWAGKANPGQWGEDKESERKSCETVCGARVPGCNSFADAHRAHRVPLNGLQGQNVAGVASGKRKGGGIYVSRPLRLLFGTGAKATHGEWSLCPHFQAPSVSLWSPSHSLLGPIPTGSYRGPRSNHIRTDTHT